jgi:predicted transposase/invertase (TIGR01784 family)
MAEMGPIHDSFFRSAFGRAELAADFLQHYLPLEVAAVLDPDPASLTRRPDTYVDPRLSPLAADLVYDARLRDGRPAVVYVLFEHKSRPERLVAFQLLRYQVEIWDEDAKAGRPLVPIIPVVVYHGESQWRVPVTFGALFDGPEALRPYWPEYRYEVTDVSHLPPAEVRGAVATQIALRVLRSILLPRLREELAGIAELLWTPGDWSWTRLILAIAMKYVMAAPNDIEEAELWRIMSTAPPEAQEVVVTIAETLRQEGRQQGIEQGIERGLEQGLDQARAEAAEGIQLALELKFGAQGLALMPEVAAIGDLAALRAVRDAIRPARTVDDIRAVYRRAAA